MLYGVDVHARYQAGLDIPLLAQQGYTFLTTKASEGLSVPSTSGFSSAQFTARMLSWVDQTRAAGMIPGLYHWINAGDGAAQARFFYGLVKQAGGPRGLLIQLDCEDDAGYSDVQAWAAEWSQLSGGHPFLLYTGGWWWRPRGWDGNAITPLLWDSHYLSADTDTIPDDPAVFAARIPADWWTPGYGRWPSATFLQFTSRGDAGSLGNNVDLNATRLTYAQLRALTGEDMTLPIRPVVRPSVLAGQVNGKLDPAILRTWTPPWGNPAVTLVAPAMRCYQALVGTAYAQGIELRSVGSYRTYERQVELFTSRYKRVDYVTSIRWDGSYWVHVSGAIAAIPGTSNHGWGLADDIGEERDGDDGIESISPDAVAWLIANAADFGYSAELQSEPWHWRQFTGDTIPPAVLRYEEDDMPTAEEVADAVVAKVLGRSGPTVGVALQTGAYRNTEDLKTELAALRAEVATLTAAVAANPPGGLSEDQVRAAVRAELDRTRLAM